MSHKKDAFAHYLITRFNLKKEDWKLSRADTPVLTETWLKNRFELFENYCFPCIVGQTNKNFKWMVFFDTSTPELYVQKIKHLQTLCAEFKPIFVDGMNSFLPGIEKEIELETTPYLITTRLDNDDCVSQDFVDVIQSFFNHQEYLAIDFPQGYTLKTQPQYQLGNKIHAFNPFISLIEKNQQPKTVWSKSHTEWKKEKKIKRVMEQRIWMSIIHAENKVNTFNGFDHVPTSTLNEFNISQELKTDIEDHILLQSQWQWTSFKNKVASYFVLYSKDLKKILKLY